MSRVIAHIRTNTVAYLALFVALSGTVYAAATVGPKDIKPNAVRDKQAKENSFGLIRTQRVTINDPDGDDVNTDKVLLKRGPFQITVGCLDRGAKTPPQAQSTFRIASETRAWVVGASGSSTLAAGSSKALPTTGINSNSLDNDTERGRAAPLTIADKDGRFLSVSIHIAFVPQNDPTVDCAYIVSGIAR